MVAQQPSAAAASRPKTAERDWCSTSACHSAPGSPASRSAQNIDQLASLYRATKQANRIFVLDLYTATIAAATNRPKTIPQAT